MFEFYEVGGAVRDALLGLKSKDIDFTAVPDDVLLQTVKTAPGMFDVLFEYLEREGYQIFLSTPDCYTIRAKFPIGHENEGLVADFVMARKEVGYIKGTRTPKVVPGTLYDDLVRRDFTVNAIAKDKNGNLIDHFGGMQDLEKRFLRTPLPAAVTFMDDPLRMLRAVRFSVTKDFKLSAEIKYVIKRHFKDMNLQVVSSERIREEMYKSFKANTLKTLEQLNEFPALKHYIFTNTDLWLKPTNEN